MTKGTALFLFRSGRTEPRRIIEGQPVFGKGRTIRIQDLSENKNIRVESSTKGGELVRRAVFETKGSRASPTDRVTLWEDTLEQGGVWAWSWSGLLGKKDEREERGKW